MKGVYLASRKHRIPGYGIVYNDIVKYPGISLLCDMLDVDLKKFDFIIATPPCNYYSKANYRRDTSSVALSTKHLLPRILEKLYDFRFSKPFIVENVCNKSLLPKADWCYQFSFGEHHFYTNIFMVIPSKSYAVKQNKAGVCRNKRDDNFNVDFVIRLFLYTIKAGLEPYVIDFDKTEFAQVETIKFYERARSWIL